MYRYHNQSELYATGYSSMSPERQFDWQSLIGSFAVIGSSLFTFCCLQLMHDPTAVA